MKKKMRRKRGGERKKEKNHSISISTSSQKSDLLHHKPVSELSQHFPHSLVFRLSSLRPPLLRAPLGLQGTIVSLGCIGEEREERIQCGRDGFFFFVLRCFRAESSRRRYMERCLFHIELVLFTPHHCLESVKKGFNFAICVLLDGLN